MAFLLVGACLGGFVQFLASGNEMPIMGFVIGGLCFFGLHEAFRE